MELSLPQPWRACTKGAWPSPAGRCLLGLGILLVVAGTPAWTQMPGQKAPLPAQATVIQTSTGLRATSADEVLDVTVCGDSVIHVVARPVSAEAHPSPRPWILDAQQSCAGASFTLSQDARFATLKTAKLEVAFQLTRGNLSFRSLRGEKLLDEGSSVPRTYEPVELNGEHTFRVTDRFSPAMNEALFGLGQHQSGLFNYRGATVELAQNNTDVAIPFLMSSNGYALLWNTAALTYVDNRFPLDLTLTSIAGKSVDYYFFYGPEMDTIIHEYRSLTGHTPMLPRWAYGFFQSKDRYMSLEEIRGIADRYRREHIPLDAMVQDWFWWKKEGDPVFNDKYHDVAADLAALHDENVHTMISVWGLLDPGAETYKALDAKHLLIPIDAHVYDASNAEARDIYWDRLPGKLLAQGWDAFLAGQRRARGVLAPHGRRHPAQQDDRHRQRRRVHQCLSSAAYAWGTGPLEGRDARQARLSAHAFPPSRGSSVWGPRSGPGMCMATTGASATRCPRG